MKAKTLFLFISIFLIKISASGQSIDCELIDKSIKYELISFMQVGDMEYFDDTDNDYEAGVRYRLIIKRFEIHESLYIEKLIVDIEGIPRRVDWCKNVNLDKLIDLYKLDSEQTNIKILDWDTYNEFTIELNDMKFKVKIENDSADNVKVTVIKN